MIERGADLYGQAAGNAGHAVDLVAGHEPGDEPRDPDGEHQQRGKEEKQPERDRAADHRSLTLPIAAVQAKRDADDRHVFVLVEPGLPALEAFPDTRDIHPCALDLDDLGPMLAQLSARELVLLEVDTRV